MDPERLKVLDKIRKLLAKARDAAVTDAEALAFAAKAQELLESHKLAMTDVEFDAMRESDPIRQWYVAPEDIGIKRKRARVAWAERLAKIVAHAHMCEIIVHFKSNSFTLVGRQADAEVAIFVYHYLYTTLEMLEVRAYRKECTRCRNLGNVTLARGFREAYRHAFITRIRERYEERRRASTSTGVALVRIDDELARAKSFVQDLMNAPDSKLKKTTLTTRVRTHEVGARQGRRAADEIDLDRRGIKRGTHDVRQLGGA